MAGTDKKSNNFIYLYFKEVHNLWFMRFFSSLKPCGALQPCCVPLNCKTRPHSWQQCVALSSWQHTCWATFSLGALVDCDFNKPTAWYFLRVFMRCSSKSNSLIVLSLAKFCMYILFYHRHMLAHFSPFHSLCLATHFGVLPLFPSAQENEWVDKWCHIVPIEAQWRACSFPLE